MSVWDRDFPVERQASYAMMTPFDRATKKAADQQAEAQSEIHEDVKKIEGKLRQSRRPFRIIAPWQCWLKQPLPIPSMYGIFTNIYLDLGDFYGQLFDEYTIHGWYGYTKSRAVLYSETIMIRR